MGVAAQLLENDDEAIRAYDEALNLARGRIDSNIDNEDDSAVIDQANMLSLASHAIAVVWNNYGNLWRQRGSDHFNEALDAYAKSLEAGGENAAVYNNIALVHIACQNFDDAEVELHKALQLNPNLECAQSNLMRLREYRKQVEGGKS